MKFDQILVKNTFYQFIGKVSISIFGFLTTYLLTHYLGSIGFSEYSFIFSFVSFPFLFADFGFNALLIRKFAQEEDIHYFSYIFNLRILLSLLVGSIAVLVIMFLHYSLNIKVGIAIAVFYNIFFLLSGSFWSTFQGRLDYIKSTIPQVLIGVVILFLVSIGVFLGFGLLYFVFASLFASIIGFIISFYLASKKPSLFQLHFAKFKTLIREALPFGAGLIMSALYFKIDSLVLAFFFNPSQRPDVGIYALAYRFFEVSIVFGGLFTQVLYPIFSKILHTKAFEQHAKKYLLWTSILAGIIMAGLYFGAGPLILFLGGKDFLAAVQSLQILSLAAGFSILAGYFISIALARHREVLLFKLSVITLVLNLSLNLFLIPHYSYIAASWVTVLTQAFVLVTNWYASRKS